MATLARECAKVVVTDLDDPRGQAVISEIVSAGGDALLVHEDVSLEESWPEIIEATERRFGLLDVMVANAGIGIMCEAVEMSLADLQEVSAPSGVQRRPRPFAVGTGTARVRKLRKPLALHEPQIRVGPFRIVRVSAFLVGGGPCRPVPVFVLFSRFGDVELAGVGTAATVFSQLLIRQH